MDTTQFEAIATTVRVIVMLYRQRGEDAEDWLARIDRERSVAHWRANQLQYVPCVKPTEPGLVTPYPFGDLDWR